MQVQGALQRCFRIAGRGSVSRVQRVLDLGAGYFKNQRRPGRRRVDLRVLFRALEILDVDPAEFFASILGTADPVEGFSAQAAALRRRVRKLGGILALEAQRPERPESCEEIDLAAFDALRIENPRRALLRAKSLIPNTPDSQLPRLLGIYASACRVLGRLDEAQMVLARALKLAQERDDPEAVAELVQRSSYVAAHRGQLESALALSEKATLLYVALGDLVGVGKTQVDQGNWLFHLDRDPEAIEVYCSAVRYLPAASERLDVRRNRYSALMNLAVSYQRTGDLESARDWAAQARGCSEGIGPGLLARAAAFQGSLAERCGRNAEAEEFFLQALEMYRPIAPIDAALCSVDVVRVQLRAGRTAEAYETAKAMTSLIGPLEHDRVAAAAVTEVIRCALAGRGLSVRLLNRMAQGIKKGRARG